MLMPSIFGENLFDDFWEFPFFDNSKEQKNIEKKLYDLKFVYDDESLKTERFTGEFSTDNLPDEILNVLMHTNHFSYKKEGRIIRLSKK